MRASPVTSEQGEVARSPGIRTPVARARASRAPSVVTSRDNLCEMRARHNPMPLTNGGSFTDKVNFIWSVADLLRGTYKQSEYGRGRSQRRPCGRGGAVVRRLPDRLLGRRAGGVRSRGRHHAGGEAAGTPWPRTEARQRGGHGHPCGGHAGAADAARHGRRRSCRVRLRCGDRGGGTPRRAGFPPSGSAARSECGRPRCEQPWVRWRRWLWVSNPRVVCRLG